MARKKKTVVPAPVLATALDALGTVERALAEAGLEKLPAVVNRGRLQMTNAPVKKPKPCKGCPPGLPVKVLELPAGAQRIYVVILTATETDSDEFLGAKELVKKTKISARSVSRHLGALRELDAIHFVPRKGLRAGAPPTLFSATS